MNRLVAVSFAVVLAVTALDIAGVLAPASVRGAVAVPPGFTATDWVTGFGDRLTSSAWSPDGRLFVNEKGGRVRIVKNGSLLSQPFLTVSVDTTSERGLTGIAFDPSFATNRYIYVYYTNLATLKNRVSRFRASSTNPDVVEAGSETILLDNIPSDSGMHNAGAMHFGLDGKLYVAVGDSGTGSNAQNLGILPGKMLRLNSDGTIPSDNPYVGQSGRRAEIWASGLRNPYTFAVQGTSGRMFINDVGNATWEEVDEGFRGANYGWPTCEGPCGNASFVDPLYAYRHDAGPGKSITGAVFYSGNRFPANYSNDYFFGDYVGNYIKRYDMETGQVLDFATATDYVVDITVGPDGALYWVSVEGKKVGRIDYIGTTATPPPTPVPTPTRAPVGQPPSPTISRPTSGTTYQAGQLINFAGSARDREDGKMKASALTWEVLFHHDTHTHPFYGPVSGISSGSFTIPDTGEASANTWYRIHLRATDSDGNTTEVTRDVTPLKAQVTLDTVPSGLTVTLDGQPVTTPYTFTGVVNFKRQLGAPSPQTLAGVTYQFDHWSDGGSATHTYVTPSTASTVVATFVASSNPPPPTTYATDSFSRTVSGGWGSATTGGAYTLEGLLSNFSVNGTSGDMILPGPGTNRAAVLTATSARDVDVRFRVRANKLPTADSIYAYAIVRRTGTSAYQPKLIITPTGALLVHSGVIINGSESSIAPAVTLSTPPYSPGSWVWVRAQVTGASPTTIRVKAWLDGTAEPSAWAFTATESSAAVQVPGAVGLRAVLGPAATNAPVTVTFDDLTATSP